MNDEKISLFNRKVHLLEYSQTHHHILHTFKLTFNSELIHFNAFKQVKKKNQPLYPP